LPIGKQAADKARAVRLYKELVDTFPDAPEAKQARPRLQALGVK
jgi:TolA-binding protein